jgi:signal transduction histidine kinase
MVSLARRQERELRDWLFSDDDPVATTGTTFRRSITDAAAAVEEIHHVPIDVVAVGDLDMSGDDRLAAMVAATREAMSNAARHSGTGSIDVYAEVSSPRVEVFVRDTGTGFDPSAVAEDRRGIADSIEGRMRRVGGWAIIESTAGHGTEIAMGIERRADG